MAGDAGVRQNNELFFKFLTFQNEELEKINSFKRSPTTLNEITDLVSDSKQLFKSFGEEPRELFRRGQSRGSYVMAGAG